MWRDIGDAPDVKAAVLTGDGASVMPSVDVSTRLVDAEAIPKSQRCRGEQEAGGPFSDNVPPADQPHPRVSTVAGERRIGEAGGLAHERQVQAVP